MRSQFLQSPRISPLGRRGGLPWTPALLFANGEGGAWYEDDPAKIWSDTAGTTPITDGDPVARIDSTAGNGNVATNGTLADRPAYDADRGARVYSGAEHLEGTELPGSSGNTLAVHLTWDDAAAAVEVPIGCTGWFIALRPGTGKLTCSVGGRASSTNISDVAVHGQTGVAVLTEDGSDLRLYWNGEEVFTSPQTGGSPGTTRVIYEGTFNNNGSPAASNYFTGSIYNSLSIQRALTPEEVTQLTNYWLDVPSNLLPISLETYGLSWSGTDQYRNGGVAESGASYAVRRTASEFAKVSADGATVTRSDFGLASAFNTSGLILGVNGLLYSPPRDSTFAVIVDPDTDTATTDDFGLTISSDGNKWTDGVLGNDGKIYCAPSSANTILIIDTNTTPATATMSNLGATFSAASTGGADMQWIDGVKAADGRIFFVPYSASSVLVVDPDLGTATLEDYGLTFGGTGTQNWSRGALGADGKIYCAPRDADKILVIDPATDTAEFKTYDLDLSAADKYSSVYSLSDGRLYFPPSRQKTVLVIDPITEETAQVPIDGITDIDDAPYFIGGMVGLDGVLRCPPRSSNAWLIIG